MRVGALVAGAVLALAAQAGAGYSVDPGASLDGRTLRVAPRVSGPPGERLRFEIAVRRDGEGSSSDNQQSGTVTLDRDGRAELAHTSVSVQPGQSFSIKVKLFEGQRLVAERSVTGP